MDALSSVSAHGGLQDRELAALGLKPEEVLDFSVNVNPYGPCEPLLDALRCAPLDRYPDPQSHTARRALAEFLRVSPERIVIGNGAAELLWLLARVLLRPGQPFATVEPTFSEMRRAALRVGARCCEHRLDPSRHFRFDPGAFRKFIREHQPNVAYLCSPGNPTGVQLPMADLMELAQEFRATRFVVDLSFDSLADAPHGRVEGASEQVIWVRSLTKDLGLPGLRLGYCVVTPELAEAMEAERPPWSVNAAAQAAIQCSVSASVREFVETSRRRLLTARGELTVGLARLGLGVQPSSAPYCLVDLGTARSAQRLRERLLRKHAVLVRDASSFGLPHHIRIAARPSAQLERLFSALTQCL